MKNLKKRKIAFFLFLLGSLSANAYCSSRWDQFIQNPTKDSLIVLQKSIENRSQHCRTEVIPDQRQRIQLFEFIGDGNPFAFRAALLMSECLDGGEIEDFYRSSGAFFERHPQIFMRIVKDQGIKDTELNFMLIMLPLDTVDNINLKLSVVENRIAILKTINDKSFIGIKEKGLSFLEKERQNLEKIRNQLEK